MTRPTPKSLAGRLPLTGLLTTMTLLGCGQSSPAVTTSASAVLSTDVQHLHVAAQSGNATHVDSAAAQLRTDLAAQRAAGHLSRDRMTAILDQLARVVADSAASTPVTAGVPSPSSSDTGHKGEGQHNGGDNGDSNDGG